MSGGLADELVAVFGVRLPRRHRAAPGDGGDLRRVRTRAGVGQQAERRGAAGW